MTIDERPASLADRQARMLLHFEVEHFYFTESNLLDDKLFEEWLALFTEDTHYFMPIRRTRTRRELDKEFTTRGQMAFFDDDYEALSARIVKLNTGSAWAEDPPSRTRHFVNNVVVTADRGDELDVRSNFILYRTRLKSEELTWIGSRQDVLRRHGDSFRIAQRTIFLEQTLLLSQNLSNFF